MTPSAESAPDSHVGRQLYATMSLIAACDDRLRLAISRGEFAAVAFPVRGHEAIGAGLGLALRHEDRLICYYRGTHNLIGKGVPLQEIIGEIAGRTIGASRGKGGTMHTTCPEHGVMLNTGCVGAGVPVAVGVALAAMQQESGRVVAVSFGDGATNTGAFHEAMNLASTWQLPIVFVCENNQYAESTPTVETMHIARIAERALAYAMPGCTIDGNDPDVVYQTISEAAEKARAGGGPTLVECVTFRLKGHYVGDTHRYMPPGVLEAAEANDPIPRYRKRLITAGISSEEQLAAVDRHSSELVEAAMREVATSPLPESDELDRDVFLDMEGVPT